MVVSSLHPNGLAIGVQDVLVTQDSCPSVAHSLTSLRLTQVPLTAAVMFPLD